jgi:hypothetical protein
LSTDEIDQYIPKSFTERKQLVQSQREELEIMRHNLTSLVQDVNALKEIIHQTHPKESAAIFQKLQEAQQ